MDTLNSTTAWLTPAVLALFSYGLGQGLVKQRVGDIAPARFCLHFILAKAVVNLSFFLTQPHPPLFAPEARAFFWEGVFAYLLDGAGWILYFQSILAGPITLVGTLSAAYPALTVLLARLFLGETLSAQQGVGIALTLAGCITLSVPFTTGLAAPSTEAARKPQGRLWILQALIAVAFWGVAQTIVKHAYTLPGNNEVNFAVPNTLGGLLTLGLYGLVRGRAGGWNGRETARAFLPMALLAGGDLGVIVANRLGPVSLVTALTGAYPAVTLVYASIVLKERVHRVHWLAVLVILSGMTLATWSPTASPSGP